MFEQGQLSGTNPVILELIENLKAFEEAAKDLETAEEELEHALTSLFAQYSDDEVTQILDHIANQTGLDTEPFKPGENVQEVDYIR